MNAVDRTILVAGAQGVIGRAAAAHFADQEGTTVYGISRRAIAALDGVRPLGVDLLNPADAREKLKGLGDVTHMIFSAYLERDTRVSGAR